MRDEEIKQKIKEETAQREKEIKRILEEKYEKNRERYINQFKGVIEDALNISNDKINESIKGPVKYIYINCLRTSIETETYNYVIRVMDEKKYSDKEVVEKIYTPEYMTEYINQDKKYFEKLIMDKIIRAKKYEVKDFMRDYIWETYIHPIPKEIKEFCQEIEKMEVYKKIPHEKEVMVNYGEVLERIEYFWKFT